MSYSKLCDTFRATDCTAVRTRLGSPSFVGFNKTRPVPAGSQRLHNSRCHSAHFSIAHSSTEIIHARQNKSTVVRHISTPMVLTINRCRERLWAGRPACINNEGDISQGTSPGPYTLGPIVREGVFKPLFNRPRPNRLEDLHPRPRQLQLIAVFLVSTEQKEFVLCIISSRFTGLSKWHCCFLRFAAVQDTSIWEFSQRLKGLLNIHPSTLSLFWLMPLKEHRRGYSDLSAVILLLAIGAVSFGPPPTLLPVLAVLRLRGSSNTWKLNGFPPRRERRGFHPRSR